MVFDPAYDCRTSSCCYTLLGCWYIRPSVVALQALHESRCVISGTSGSIERSARVCVRASIRRCVRSRRGNAWKLGQIDERREVRVSDRRYARILPLWTRRYKHCCDTKTADLIFTLFNYLNQLLHCFDFLLSEIRCTFNQYGIVIIVF